MVSVVSGAPSRDLGDIAAAPTFLQLFASVARRLEELGPLDGQPPAAARAVLACPTLRHLPAAMSACGVRLEDPPSVSLQLGLRVATVLSGSFEDAVVTQLEPRIRLNGVNFCGDTPPLYPCPVDLPTRSSRRIPELVRAQMGSRGRDTWRYQKLCGRPIVILCQRPEQVAADAAELAELTVWSADQRAALLDLGTIPLGWLRHPILALHPTAVSGKAWLSSLSPRLVIIAGFAAWDTPARHIWSEVPQLLLLDWRSADVDHFRAWHDGLMLTRIETALGEQLSAAGIQVKFFGEPVVSAPVDDEEPEF